MRSRTKLIGLATAVLMLILTVGAVDVLAQRPGCRGGAAAGGGGGPWFEHGAGGPEGGGGPFAGRIEALAEQLELTDAQLAKLEEIRETGRQQRVELRKQLMRLENEMRGVMLADEPDATAAVVLVKKIGDARTQMAVHRLERRLAMRGVLTPEQRDELLDLGPRAARWGGRGRHHGQRGGPRGPGR